MIVAFMAVAILIYLIYAGLKDEKDEKDKNTSTSDKKINNKNIYNNESNKKENKINNNINNRINRAMINYAKDVGKYNIGAKSYEYDFIDNEQPLNGLSPNFEQNYPSTLKKSNKMFVVPDLSINYDNLLNTKNNSLKNYIYNMK